MMGFIRIYPLKEITELPLEAFGRGEPARCQPEYGMGMADYYLGVQHIVAFEECPLYVVSEADPNALINGVRIRLADNTIVVIPDDAENEAGRFQTLLRRALQGEIVEMEHSTYIAELAM